MRGKASIRNNKWPFTLPLRSILKQFYLLSRITVAPATFFSVQKHLGDRRTITLQVSCYNLHSISHLTWFKLSFVILTRTKSLASIRKGEKSREGYYDPGVRWAGAYQIQGISFSSERFNCLPINRTEFESISTRPNFISCWNSGWVSKWSQAVKIFEIWLTVGNFFSESLAKSPTVRCAFI